MKKLLLRHICLLALAWGSIVVTQARAQSDSTRPKHIVGLHLTQLAVREVQLSYERYLSPHYSLEGMAGIKISNDNVSSARLGGMFDLDVNYNMPFFSFAKSYYAAAGTRYYFRGTKFFHPYIAANLFFINNYYDNKRIEVITFRDDSSYSIQQSQNQRIWGLKVHLGFRMLSLKIGRIRIAVDSFAGIGLRYKAIESTIYEYEHFHINLIYPEPQIKKENMIVPSIQAGMKLNVCWR